ncbi:uncharacterized protein TA02655 [Theileria annulata]|uniref:U3 small nucleolar RNA-associated protein 6 N-terminal domain-containing protein n=1 Tax=Theileria annulata TaxID=5874 RepID=Q4UD34_THEAN|nr:uncharacterized protein TA02655 [Theileria annulata]CAI75267.1 hypothetical protein, conserved [Theileria annulata]|eukprot:XP_954743.1 hypothetical protein, conserved [Theileria annulata]
MADRVQKQLEDFAPDLRELLLRDLFTLKEIKSIVDRRRKFEFDIISPDPNLSLISYKNYIKYELELDKLLQSRYRKSKLMNKNKNSNHSTINNTNKSNIPGRKKFLVEVNNKRYIHRIFRRCINRFIGNIEMYQLYLNYCKKIKSFKLFEKVLVNGISKNPNEEILWLIFASYVLKNKGIRASKNIIQKSLRILPNSLNLLSFLLNLQVKIILNSLNDTNNTGTDNTLKNSDDSKESNLELTEFTTVDSPISGEVDKCWIIYKYAHNNLNEADLNLFNDEIISIISKIPSKSPLLKKSLDQLLNNINDLRQNNSDITNTDANNTLDNTG